MRLRVPGPNDNRRLTYRGDGANLTNYCQTLVNWTTHMTTVVPLSYEKVGGGQKQKTKQKKQAVIFIQTFKWI